MISTNKGLFALVIGLGFFVAMGFGALITGLIIKAKDPIPLTSSKIFTDKLVSEQFKLNSEEKININIPKGFRIKTATSNAIYISLHIQNNEDQEGILIVEPRTGKVLEHYIIRSMQ